MKSEGPTELLCSLFDDAQKDAFVRADEDARRAMATAVLAHHFSMIMAKLDDADEWEAVSRAIKNEFFRTRRSTR